MDTSTMLEYIVSVLLDGKKAENVWESGIGFIRDTNIFARMDVDTLNDICENVLKVLTRSSAGSVERKIALNIIDSLVAQREMNTAFVIYCLSECAKGFTSHSPKLEFKILGALVNRYTGTKEVKRHIILNIIPKFVENLDKSPECLEKLQCLRIILEAYYPHIGKFKVKLRNYLTDMVSKQDMDINSEIPVLARTCYCLLPLVGASNNTQLEENWFEQFHCLLKTMHAFLLKRSPLRGENNIAEELEKYNIYEEILVPYRSAEVGENLIILLKGYRVLSHLIGLMLSLRYPAVKKYNPRIILNLVSLMLDLSVQVQGPHFDVDSFLASTPPVVHILKPLITCGSRNLIPHGPIISALCIQYARHVHASAVFENDILVGMDMLTEWLAKCQNSSSIESSTEKIWLIIQDYISVPWDAIADPEHLDKIKIAACAKAHALLREIIKSGAIFLSEDFYVDVERTITRELLNIQNPGQEQYYIYENPVCRMQLYKTMLTLITCEHPRHAPPVSYALSVFSTGCYDSDQEVSEFCRLAVDTVRNIIHTRGPSLDIYSTSHQDSWSSSRNSDFPSTFTHLSEVDGKEEIMDVETENNSVMNAETGKSFVGNNREQGSNKLSDQLKNSSLTAENSVKQIDNASAGEMYLSAPVCSSGSSVSESGDESRALGKRKSTSNETPCECKKLKVGGNSQETEYVLIAEADQTSLPEEETVLSQEEIHETALSQARINYIASIREECDIEDRDTIEAMLNDFVLN